MKIFIICCLLFILVNMCIFICGFRVSFGFWVSAGLVLVVDFHPNRFRVRVSISGFGARRLHPIRTRPVAILNPWPPPSPRVPESAPAPSAPSPPLFHGREEEERQNCLGPPPFSPFPLRVHPPSL